MTQGRRSVRELKGFVFDLDGCVWTGDVLMPGAGDVLALLREQGRGVTFLTNNSRARAATLQAKLGAPRRRSRLAEVLTPLEILGEVIATRWGPSPVLAIGGEELEAALTDGGHSLVPVSRYREARVVVVGNDFALLLRARSPRRPARWPRARTSSRRTSIRACRWRASDFLPGCGAIVEAVATAAGVRPHRGRQARAAAVRAGPRPHGGDRGGRGHGGRQRGLGHPRRAPRGA